MYFVLILTGSLCGEKQLCRLYKLYQSDYIKLHFVNLFYHDCISLILGSNLATFKFLMLARGKEAEQVDYIM